MPVFRNHAVLSMARNIKAFLNIEAGVVRSPAPEKAEEAAGGPSGAASAGPSGVRPEDIVWIFGYGSGRSGSTWLSTLFRDLEGNRVWVAPMVGKLFGLFHHGHLVDDYTVVPMERGRSDYVLGADKGAWLPSVRNFILENASARFPDFGGRGSLVVNEAHGSIGAPIISEALPESRIVLLLRDPRDVAASLIKGKKKGGWIYDQHNAYGAEDGLADSDPEAFIERLVNHNVKSMGNALKAYDRHPGPKSIVRYEDLRDDALGGMRRVHRDLGLEYDEAELARVVERHSWENVPEEKKGEGEFYRKASSRGWEEDLNGEQAKMVEEAFEALIGEHYPESPAFEASRRTSETDGGE